MTARSVADAGSIPAPAPPATGERRYQKLRPGPGLSPDEVLTNQRVRLLSAMVAIVGESGYRSVKVRELSHRAGVSTRTFYQHFANIPECMAATYGWVMGETLAKVTAAATESHPQALQARFEALLETFARHPKAARLVLLEVCGAEPVVTEREGAAVRRLERIVRDDLGGGPDAFDPPWYLPRGIAAAALWLARRHLLDRGNVDLSEASKELSDWALAFRDEAANRLTELQNCATQIQECAPRPTAPTGDGRRRLLDASARLAIAGGYAALTGPAVRRAAGVPRRMFDASFSSLEDCFLEAVEAQVIDAVGRSETHTPESASFPEAAVTAIGALCIEIARKPDQASMVLMEAMAPGPHGLERHDRIVARLAERFVKCPREGAPDRRLDAEASVAAIWGIVRTEMTAGRGDKLATITPLASYVLLAPVCGPEIAERIIDQQLRPARSV